MRGKLTLLAGVCAGAIAFPAYAQEADTAPASGEIVVTAQRTAERLQDVPIAVSAFSGEALEKQQIKTTSDLQLTLPNVTYTKTNFSGASFTIRGIGDLCVGISCDAATGIHQNDMPLVASRLFETEFFDMERIEVLRGPQGTLFGRNATSGVVNLITAKPKLGEFGASAEAEYGNFESTKLKGTINVPLGETLALRVAGSYTKRDGYTLNLFNNTRIDNRDLYAVRGSLRWEPTPTTRLDLMAYYFREKDSRSRIQKQLCHRDPTGVLGCLPDRLANETTNADSTLAGVLGSRELLGIATGSATFAALGLGSLYQTDGDSFSGVVNPADVRTVNIDYSPTYYAREEIYQAKLNQELGDSLNMVATAGYSVNTVNSRSDYNLAVERSLANNPGLQTLATYAITPGLSTIFAPMASRLIPNGPGGNVCQSDIDQNNVGIFGAQGLKICAPTSLDFDQSSQTVKQKAAEVHFDSKLDGMFNFLIGANYLRSEVTNGDYFVNSFALDYVSGVLGAAVAASGATGGVPVFRASPFYRSNTAFASLDSYGIFGEGYFKFNDALKLTIGLRYNHDKKTLRARTTLLSDGNSTEFAGGAAILTPFGAARLEDSLNYAASDFDRTTPGVQAFQVRAVSFGRMTGRAVLDYKISPDNLLYASYSRGYKSGGINPPISVGSVGEIFKPETVDSFEIGSKNRFGNLQLNLSAFYYRYRELQLSRIIARTSVNDNIDADIYGVEAEAVVSPGPGWLINMNASYLNSKVVGDQLLINPRDVSAGRSDTVIIKDITLGSNCAVTSTGGSAAAVNAFVGGVNGALGLQAPVAIPGTATTGAFSICGALAAAAAGSSGAFVVSSGVPVNVKGNRLPQAPEFKWSAGAQYTAQLGGDVTLVPRFDIAFTGNSYGTIFNGVPDRVPSYFVMNASLQLNGQDDKWFIRGFIQNISNNNATTGLYVTDQSSGLFTNIFTLEPRRYGIAAGIKF